MPAPSFVAKVVAGYQDGEKNENRDGKTEDGNYCSKKVKRFAEANWLFNRGSIGRQ
jgi:hypothetical protein